MKIEEVLTDIEKQKIQRFLEDKITANAVKKVLLYGIYYNGVLNAGLEIDPTINFALNLAFKKEHVTDEQIGRDLRACAEGIRLVESGFVQMGKLIPDLSEESKEIINEAR